MATQTPEGFEKYSKFALTLGEDTYASQSAQNPNSARRMLSLYPSLAGYLEREQRHPKFLAAQLAGGRVGFLDQFNWFDTSSKLFTTFFFAATATKLYKQKVGTDSDWVEVTAVGTLQGFPTGAAINNLFHFSDGVTSWIFDGSTWVKDGLEIPSTAPAPTIFDPALISLSVTIASRVNGIVTLTLNPFDQVTEGALWVVSGFTDTSLNGTYRIITVSTVSGVGSATTITYTQVGLGYADTSGITGTPVMTMATFDVVSNRYYWTTFVDKTTTRPHESSSSPQSLGTGAFTTKDVLVQMRVGYASLANGNATVVGQGSDFNSRDVGLKLRVIGSNQEYTILTYVDAQHITVSPTPSLNVSVAHYIIYPARATHWRLYASASEEDKAGLLLAENSVSTQSATAGFFNQILDQSSFLNEDNSYFQRIERPLRNDPTPPTHTMEIHKRRIFRRLETQPNYFNYSAAEEVLSLLVGAPEECVPGADDNTLSDRVNESSYPEESDQIRALTHHGSALYIATDDETTPLFGESIDDFSLSDVAIFKVGAAGRYVSKSTPHGLAFGSNDKKIYLYPSASPSSEDATSSLIELSRPERPKFEAIKSTDLDNWHLVYYNWGRRNWVVTCYQDSSSVFHTLVFDFETKTWAELGTGFSSLTVFKVAPGKKVLIGGGSDGYVYVIDDLTGTYTGSGNYPEGIFRTAPLDFGKPERDHIIHGVEFETSDDSLMVEVRVYLDPPDADTPTSPIVLNMAKTRLGVNRYRGFITGATGGACQRAMVEIKVLAGTVNAKIRGLCVYAEPGPQFGAK